MDDPAKKKKETQSDPKPAAEVPSHEADLQTDEDGLAGQIPTSLNDELAEKLKEDPNKFIGCGG